MARTITYEKLTARYRFEENTVDDIGGNNGVASGGVSYETIFPMLGTAHFDPDGIDDKMTISDDAAIDPGTGNFSFGIAVDVPAAPQSGYIISKFDGVSKGYYLVIAGGGAAKIFVWDSVLSVMSITGTTDLRSAGKTLCCVSYDKSVDNGFKLYVGDNSEGTPLDVRTGGTLSNGTDLLLSVQNDLVNYTNVPMDEFIFTNGYVMTADDVRYLNNDGFLLSLEPSTMKPINHASPMNMVLPMETT